MEQINFEKILTESLDSYRKKTESFNDKPTVLICHPTEEKSFVDLSERIGITFDEKIFLDPTEKFSETLLENKNYFFSNQVMTDDLYNQLATSCASENQIYVGPTKDAYFDLYPKRYIIYENLERIDEAVNLFADDRSRRIFLNVITRLCLPYQYHYFYEITTEPQYFPKEFSFSNAEIFLDAGVCDGQNILEFIECVHGNYKHIYGIEADTENFRLSEKNLTGVHNLELIHGALFSKQGESLSFRSSKMTGKMGNARVQGGGDTFVTSISGDELKYSPTFVKMDIEGAEKQALMGLRHTIKTFAPKLAVCVYHFQKDFWEIPLLIKKLNPEYKLFMRTYEKMHSLLETVCYACL